MDLHRRKMGKENGSSSSHVENEQIMKKRKPNVDNESSQLNFHLLELPMLILYEILSRLPLKSIFHCRCVCKLFFELLTDPYFADIHLTKAPNTTASVIVQEYYDGFGCAPMCMLDFEGSSPPMATTSSSINARTSTSGLCRTRSRSPHPPLIQRNVNICSFRGGEAIPIGSCNGLLCLYQSSYREPLYIICNPVLGEYTVLPCATPSTPVYSYLHHSGFGFSPQSKQYKVVRYMFKKPTLKTVAEIYTVGTQSWRSIGDAPFAKENGSFDHYLNGALHWATDYRVTSDPIYSLDLHTEQFCVVPPPLHFERGYTSKISGIRIGSLKGCLCLTYVTEDDKFTVWVMKDYGARESWTNHFSIDVNFFGGLRGEDFHCPIKFSHNGDLWLVSKFKFLVSYCHEKRSFKDLRTLGAFQKTEVIAHIPSFLSLKNVVADGNLEVKKSDRRCRFLGCRLVV